MESFLTWSSDFVSQFGYLAIFVLGAISTSGVIFSFPTSLPTIILGIAFGLDPFLVGTFAGLGFATGQLVGYFAGYGGSGIWEKYRKKFHMVKKIEGLLHRHGFVFIMFYSALPVKPVTFDVVGLLSGASRYNVRKFFAATAIGYVIQAILIAYAIKIGLPMLKGVADLT